MKFDYGVMQGRLSKIINNKIQSFPEKNWRIEFAKVNKLGLTSIEWTLDYKNLINNPILTKKGQSEIKKLSKQYSIKINSLTGDCFMQKPFWKIKDNKKLITDLKKIINSCKVLGIKYIVVPLVDNGSIQNYKDEENLIKSCDEIIKYLKNSNVKLIFESDFPPKNLKILLESLIQIFLV